VGIIALLKKYTRVTKNSLFFAEAVIDKGGAPLKTSEHYADSGDDSHPLEDDYIVGVDVPRSGGSVIAGFIDAKNPGITEPGGKRIYSRDAGGTPVADVHLEPDSTITSKNGACDIEQRPDGTITSSNALSTIEQRPDGTITTSNAISSITQSPDGTITTTNGTTTFIQNISGLITLFNTTGPGLISILPNGTVSINGVLFNNTGNSIQFLSGKELFDHTHSGVTSGPSNTGVNN